MRRYVELRRHTDNDGDKLTEDGVAAADALGRSLSGGHQVIVASGAQRATQIAACVIAGLGEEIPNGVVVELRLRFGVENRWRATYQTAGAGDIESLQNADPDLVREDFRAAGRGARENIRQTPGWAAGSRNRSQPHQRGCGPTG